MKFLRYLIGRRGCIRKTQVFLKLMPCTVPILRIMNSLKRIIHNITSVGEEQPFPISTKLDTSLNQVMKHKLKLTKPIYANNNSKKRLIGALLDPLQISKKD